MTARFRLGLSLLAVALCAAACGAPSPTGPQARPSALVAATPGTETDNPDPHGESPDDFDRPPPVTVRYFDESISLDPWTYCYGNLCADGSPPQNPPDVGSPEHVIVEFPLPDWTFKATFTPAGDECGRAQTVSPEALEDGRFMLEPVGYAGAYHVTLFGRGEGDVSVTFKWTTPFDGPLPQPRARVAVVAGDPGDLQSYGVELHLSNLARTPEDAEATITVTSSEGNALTFEAERAGGHCWPEGTVYWDGPDESGTQAIRLGTPPFVYEVDLVLDGQRYGARTTWPDDQIPGNHPSVALEFDPPLPALGP